MTGGSTSVEALLEKALALHGAGSLGEAARLYEAILAQDENHAFALALFGLLRAQEGAHAEALGLFDRALRSDPRQVLAHNGKGIALKELKRPEDALACFTEAIRLKPDFAEAYCNRGNALRDLKRHDEAMADYRKALSLSPHLVDAHYNLGLTLQDLHRDADALSCFTRAVAIHPSYADAHNASGNSLVALRRLDESLAEFRKAIALKPDHEDALVNAGDTLRELRRYDEAKAAFVQALAIAKKTGDAHRSNALSHLVFTELAACDWDGVTEHGQELLAAIDAGSVAPNPFSVLALTGDPGLQRRCAELFVAHRYRSSVPPVRRGERSSHHKIRIGYLSSDFNAHAVAYLMVGVFEHHDRNRFETIAFSFGRDDGSAIRKRIVSAFGKFVDVRSKSDSDIASQMRSMEIDIAVDLNGLTLGARPGILAHRPAPVQVSYLGYAGTTAMPWIDYLVSDRIVAPDAVHFSERLVYLPDTYMCADAERAIAERTPSRAEAGLPESGFVFCSFNNSYKFSRTMFDAWARVLRQVDGSVLWLPDAGEIVKRNLRRGAEARGLAPDRLVFAPSLPSNADHLARLRLADLFLDTLPYNAHTTASDALWVGLPVLTCLGTAFAGRVAASLLKAIGVPELVTHSLEEYESAALRLATDGDLLSGIRSKLAANRMTSPLFDTARFTRHLESGFETMWRRHQDGLTPESFAVGPSPGG